MLKIIPRSGTVIQRTSTTMASKEFNFTGMETLSLNPGDPVPPLESGKLRLYNMRFCPFAQRTVLALALKDIPTEVINVNLKYKPDWFVKFNPLGKVPILEKDGQIIYESLLCNDWLDDMYPSTTIRRTDPYERAQERMLTERLCAIIPLFYAVARREEKADRRLRKTLLIANQLIADNAYFSGNSPGFADIMVWPWYERLPAINLLRADLQLKEYITLECPKLDEYCARMRAHPIIARHNRPIELHIKFFMALFQKKPETMYDAKL